eukprot:scaffold8247_cov22-Tisochrysis_lutea.AAC.1
MQLGRLAQVFQQSRASNANGKAGIGAPTNKSELISLISKKWCKKHKVLCGTCACTSTHKRQGIAALLRLQLPPWQKQEGGRGNVSEGLGWVVRDSGAGWAYIP